MYEARTFRELPSLDWALNRLSVRPARLVHMSTLVHDRLLFLYGQGKLGKFASEFFAEVGVPVTGVFEGDQDDKVPHDAQVAVCIVSSPYAPIERRLRTRGFVHVAPFYDLAYQMRDRHPLENGWMSSPLSIEEELAVERIYRGWHDDVSRAHYLQFLAWRVLREEWTFENAPLVPVADRYFIPEVRAVVHNRERFLDCGAYFGEASLKAVEVCGPFTEVTAVEPMSRNVDHLVHNISGATIVQSAVAESSRCGTMFGDGMTARLDPRGETEVEVFSVDALIDQLAAPPTFVKLHLEGSELSALRGATKTLVAARPIVVVGVYHNSDGLWRTPEWMMDKMSDYRFLFRLYCWCGCGAVVYAIPRERYGERFN